MPWEPLEQRISKATLPLVLAGPMLRHTDLETVTVWVALSESRNVTLNVYRGSGASRTNLAALPPAESGQTVQLGEYLHVVAVTAKVIELLVEKKLYYYDLDFGGGLRLKDVLEIKDITYGNDDLPSFSIPPKDLNALRLVHGSCRMPHAEGFDMLPTLDHMIETAQASGDYATDRPHQLFLTGDQIYADDVADSLLEMLTDAGDTLLGWKERLPPDNTKPKDHTPGTRRFAVLNTARLTAGIADDEKDASKSHLLSLGEYYAMYLFTWSDVLWPEEAPKLGNDTERKRLMDFRIGKDDYGPGKLKGIRAVRRALANVPTYMILDDHEITDDWFMNREFCNRVLGNELGKRVIQNALLAYAVFQAWGNTPGRFSQTGSEGEPGRELLKAAADLHNEAIKPGGSTEDVLARDALRRIADRVGLPVKPNTDTSLKRPAGALDWHYHITLPGYPYEVIVLDCRTAREYPALSALGATPDDMLPPGLLSPDAFIKQIPRIPFDKDTDGVTLVISQAPVIGLPWIEEEQRKAIGNKVWESDVEPWSLNQKSFQTLVSILLVRWPRVVVLSGDIHFGFAARLAYRARKPFGLQTLPKLHNAVLVQLTSSALHKQQSDKWLGLIETGTIALHAGGFSPSEKSPKSDTAVGILKKSKVTLGLVTPPKNQYAGWARRPSQTDVAIPSSKVEWNEKGSNRKLLNGEPAILHFDPPLPEFSKICVEDEWLYSIEFIKGKLPPPRILERLDKLSAEGRAVAKELAKVATEYREAFNEGWGTEIVGVNNIAEVRFQWPAAGKRSISQRIWWRINNSSAPLPLTTYEVPIEPFDPKPGSIKMNCP